MQIVIEINDRIYGLLKYFEESMGLNDKKDSNNDDVKTALMRAAVNGTPLPGGHGRLIDADALLQNVKEHEESYFAEDFAHYWVDPAPTIIEADKE